MALIGQFTFPGSIAGLKISEENFIALAQAKSFNIKPKTVDEYSALMTQMTEFPCVISFSDWPQFDAEFINREVEQYFMQFNENVVRHFYAAFQQHFEREPTFADDCRLRFLDADGNQSHVEMYDVYAGPGRTTWCIRVFADMIVNGERFPSKYNYTSEEWV